MSSLTCTFDLFLCPVDKTNSINTSYYSLLNSSLAFSINSKKNYSFFILYIIVFWVLNLFMLLNDFSWIIKGSKFLIIFFYYNHWKLYCDKYLRINKKTGHNLLWWESNTSQNKSLIRLYSYLLQKLIFKLWFLWCFVNSFWGSF